MSFLSSASLQCSIIIFKTFQKKASGDSTTIDYLPIGRQLSFKLSVFIDQWTPYSEPSQQQADFSISKFKILTCSNIFDIDLIKISLDYLLNLTRVGFRTVQLDWKQANLIGNYTISRYQIKVNGNEYKPFSDIEALFTSNISKYFIKI